jgi:hypothetical protein
MRNFARDEPYAHASDAMSWPWTAWTRRLLIVAIVILLWGASVLALQAAGPGAQALLAGEGMLYTNDQYSVDFVSVGGEWRTSPRRGQAAALGGWLKP